MSNHASAHHARIAFGLFAALGLSAGLSAIDLASPPPTHAMSCFMVAQQLKCIDGAGPVPLVPLAPQIMPTGIGVEGESHDLIVEDDGGYEVARG